MISKYINLKKIILGTVLAISSIAGYAAQDNINNCLIRHEVIISGNYKASTLVVVIAGADMRLSIGDDLYQRPNASDYLTIMTKLIKNYGIHTNDSATYKVIAPEFKKTCWDKNNSWIKGNESNPGDKTSSSYAVLDDYIAALKHDDPTINKVILVGHSAGAQFTLIYAATHKSSNNLEIKKYVVISPGSLMYLDQQRPKQSDYMSPAICSTKPGDDCKSGTPGCFIFNQYKFGVDDLNSYMQQFKESIVNNIKDNNLLFMVGKYDDYQHGKSTFNSLELTCPYQVQGFNSRFKRTDFYFNHYNIKNWNKYYVEKGLHSLQSMIDLDGANIFQKIFS